MVIVIDRMGSICSSSNNNNNNNAALPPKDLGELVQQAEKVNWLLQQGEGGRRTPPTQAAGRYLQGDQAPGRPTRGRV